MRIITKSVKRLSAFEYNQCYKTNMHGNGNMQRQLRLERNNPRARAYMAWEGQTLVGWALGFYDPDWTVHIYVKHEHRRKGLGRKLLARARMGRPYPVGVCPHDKASRSFYGSLIRAGRADVVPGYRL